MKQNNNRRAKQAGQDRYRNGPLGLAMTGGGARGAYHAGVLMRIGEMSRVRARGNPFRIIAGASAGAINGAALAAGCNDFGATTRLMADLWSRLSPGDIFRCDVVSQAHNSLTWMLDLTFGAVTGGGNARSLLDATPLRHFLARHIQWDRIEKNVKWGHLDAFAVSATNYHSGKSYLFIQGKKGHPLWKRSRRVTLATAITAEHVCASAAIPIVFQPVRLETAAGTAFFGDGCVRLQQPLSPVIRLGARKIVAIGVRGEEREHEEDAVDGKEPSLAQVMGVLLNVMFLDHLSTDIEHMERLNQLLANGRLGPPRTDGGEAIRPVSVLAITPSENLSKLAEEHQRDMPYLIQYFVSSLGRDASSCADLMSYLLFTSKFTRALIEIGYNDAAKRADEIEEFLFSGDGKTEPGTGSSTRAA
jgi:NTE family protein